MSIINGSAMQGATRGFYPKTIEGSLRFNDDDSAYLSATHADGGEATYTLSLWAKRSTLGISDAHIFGSIGNSGDDYELIRFNSSDQINWQLRDNTLQGNVTTNAVFRDTSAWYHLVFYRSGSTVKIYVNGVEQSITTGTAFSATTQWANNNAYEVRFGVRTDNASGKYDGYMAEVFFIDGTAHNADAFGETKNGVWVPKNVTATDFTMGTNGFHLTFQDDAEVEAFNTVLYRGDNDNATSSSITGTGFTPDLVWLKNRDDTNNHLLADSVRGPSRMLSSDTTSAESYSSSQINSFDSDGFTVGNSNGVNDSGENYVAWCWDAGANNASTGHSSVTYTGDGATKQSITGMGFRPDLVWVKQRSSGNSHILFDAVRGFGSGNGLQSQNTAAEGTNDPSYGFVSSADADGFTVNEGTVGDDYVNTSGQTYVGWGWDAGDGDPVSNTDGSITSTVKASTTNGFSIVSYTGTGANATVGHGLSSAPDWVLVKDRDNANDWIVWHSGLADGTQHLKLNANEASSANATYWNSTIPSSSVISLGNNSKTNGSSQKFIAYCWHDVTGKQKFGSYTGQGNVTLGFRPGFVLIKNITDASTDWVLYDASRNPLGGTAILRPNLSSAEASETVTITANGFTTGTGSYVGASGKTYIYMAFAGSYPDFITNVNTDGSIDSRVKASDTTGFSIVSTEDHTGSQTVGHGLSSAPDWIVAKARSGSLIWPVYHSALGNTKRLRLNDNTQEETNAVWGNTDPTTSVFTFNQSSNTHNYIFYCWTATAGVSAFGSYTGNGSSVSVTTGFLPAFILIKRSNSSAANTNWEIHDNTRNTAGELLGVIYPNTNGVEGFNNSGSSITTNSTSFTVNGSGGSINGNNDTYIYAAFADTREAAFWLDQSGNDNDWQPVNLDHNDTLLDSPTDNFCTMNPIAKFGTPSAFTLADGNLDLTFTSSSGNDSAVGTMGITSGKFYYEVELVSHADDANAGFTTAEALATETNTNGAAYYKSIGFQRGDRGVVWGSEPSPTQRFNDLQNGDVVGFALDLDALKLYIHVNGSDSPVATLDVPTDKGDTFIPCCGDDGGDAGRFIFNFGQQPFKYGPPE